MRRALFVPALVLTLAACGGTADLLTGSSSGEATGSPTPPPAVTVTEPPAVTTTTTVTTTVTPTPTRPAYALPSFVGRNLLTTEETLKSLGATNKTVARYLNGLVVVGPWQRANWTICTQSPAGGTVVEVQQVIEFGVVRLDESCPKK